MAERLRDLFRMKLAKMQEDSRARRMAFPFLRGLSPDPEVVIPSTSSSSSRERPSTSKTKKEPAPEVLEMRKQFRVIKEQLGAVALAKKVRAEKKEKDRKERKEEAKQKEVEEKAKSIAKETPSANATGSSGSISNPSGVRQDPWHTQTLVPQQHKTTAADLASKDRIRYMSYKDKCQLTRDLSQLPEKKLGGMVRILRSREPKLQKVTNNKMEVNLDILKLSTLWELKDYVASCLEKKEKTVAAKVEGGASTSKGQKDASISESESEWESPSSSDSDP